MPLKLMLTVQRPPPRQDVPAASAAASSGQKLTYTASLAGVEAPNVTGGEARFEVFPFNADEAAHLATQAPHSQAELQTTHLQS